jgi:dienelactone hydrolase
MYHSFGVLKTDDLMQLSDWLERLPYVRRTGLVSYCWTANIGLLAAWYDRRAGTTW